MYTSPALAQIEGSTAPAQESAQSDARSMGGLQDIVVTARKKTESLIDVPVAVSALGAADIAKYNTTNFTRLAEMVPQVTIQSTGGGGSGAVLTIRGIGSSSQDTGLASTVSVNIDGTQISRGRIITAGFFDLEQVEVLKGPQALFFGKNSPAGVISVSSAGATKELKGFVRAGYEFKANQRYVEGAISGPISDTLGFRVAGRASKMDGWMRVGGQVFTLPTDPLFPHAPVPYSRSPGQREYLGRVTLDWAPTDEFRAVLKVFATDSKDRTGTNSTTEIKCANPLGKPVAFDFATGSPLIDASGDCKVDGRRQTASFNPQRAAAFPNARDGNPYNDFWAVLASLNASYEGDSFSITSVTSFYKFKNKFFDNVQFGSQGNFWAYNASASRDFAQELRIQTSFDGPINLMAGGFFESESFPFNQNVSLVSLGLDPATGRFDNFSGGWDSSSKTYSGFGQVTFDILDNLQLAGGARYTYQSYKTIGGNDYVQAAFGAFGFSRAQGDLIAGKSSDDNISPEATLTWHPNGNTTLYAAYKTGFKSGGYAQANLVVPSFTENTIRFAPEKVKGFEIGAKGEFFNRKLRLTAAAYRYTFDNLQVQTFDAPTVSNQIRNAASARTTGVELEAIYQVDADLQLHGSAAYNEAKFQSFPDAPCYAGQTVAQGCVPVGTASTQSLTDRRLARAPKVNLSGGFTYDTGLTNTVRIGFTGDVRYTSNYNASETLNPVGRQNGFALLNTSVRLHDADDKWELALIAQNLTNNYYISNAIDQPLAPPGQIVGAVARPREVTLQGTFRF
ncbi:TonB-dependent receptor [Sphingobium sp. CR2-8]|uniref:TonB-dependent receptor n=1 Tax=Sphingobium sp. CR2-8 TaxID=1306534 RepID=UPI002DBCFC49|nr:TonB-dependent receptor [Sphingobium sp. CR2-8]MEC3909134.1 TonB-dependent receptor [Sphingobium sp. CR2-8]